MKGYRSVPAAHAVPARRELSLQGNPRAAAAGRAGGAGAAAVRRTGPDPNRAARSARSLRPGSVRPRSAGQDPNRQAPPPDDRGRTMPMPERPGDRRPPDSNSFGTLNIRVQPGDAVVDHRRRAVGQSRRGQPAQRPAVGGPASRRSAQGRLQALHVHGADPSRRHAGAEHQSAARAGLTQAVLTVLRFSVRVFRLAEPGPQNARTLEPENPRTVLPAAQTAGSA